MNTRAILVLGATGKTGRRIVQRLSTRGLPTRAGSRAGPPPFDWQDPRTWAPALRGIASVYLSYYPDLAVPGAADTVAEFVHSAVKSGVRRLVLLSGRGEEGAQLGERVVQSGGAEWTVLRCSWFNQNFSEGAFADMVRSGELALPAGSIAEPFVDVDDIADVAVAALTEHRHAGELYELTGPRLLTFAQAASEISDATGRNVHYVRITMNSFAASLAAMGEPPEAVHLLTYLFTEVLDGRNARLGDGVQRALDRAPRDFSDWARTTAATGIWSSASPLLPNESRAAVAGRP